MEPSGSQRNLPAEDGHLELPLLGLSMLGENPHNFLKLFYEPSTQQIQAKSSLHLHVLRVESGDFATKPLMTALLNNSLTYVLSRRNIQRMLSEPGRMPEFNKRVQSQFKTPDRNAGEGGELLLYSFLESHLQAPKILSKMELKTSSEHYVHGSDGVHLLEESPGNYQLIFGESKMYSDAKGQVGSSINRGIKAAFDSIERAVDEGLNLDTWLVDSEMLKEVDDEETVQALYEILLPPASGTPSVRKNNAFGIFVGFELDVTDYPFEAHEDSEIEEHLRSLANSAINSQISTIEDEVTSRGLGGYHFHIYVVPFLKRKFRGKIRGIENIRMEIAAEVSGKQPKDMDDE